VKDIFHSFSVVSLVYPFLLHISRMLTQNKQIVTDHTKHCNYPVVVTLDLDRLGYLFRYLCM